MREILNVASMVTRLRNGPRIVDDVSFAIAQGETFALLGESGCGKSMTALSLMRLLPDAVHIEGGAVRLGEADIAALPEREMREVRGGKMAMIFQEPGLSLNPVMTVGEQIARGAGAAPGPARRGGASARHRACCSRSAYPMRRAACTSTRSRCRAA